MVLGPKHALILIQINSTRIKWIVARLKAKGAEHQQGKHVRVLGLIEYITDVGSEASVITSPYHGEVGSELAQKVVAIADLEEEEEEEEEDPDTHFKRKRRSPPPVASPQ